MQSQPLRAWKLGLTTSYRILTPHSQVTWGVDPCNLNRWEHGSWDLPLHTGSSVLSPKSLEGSIHAISTVESMESGTYHVTHGPKSLEVTPNRWEDGSWDLPLHTRSQILSPKSLEVNPCNLMLRAWKLGLTTSHKVSRFKYDAYMVTLCGGEAWDLCWELGREKNQTQLLTQVPLILYHKIMRSHFNHN